MYANEIVILKTILHSINYSQLSDFRVDVLREYFERRKTARARRFWTNSKQFLQFCIAVIINLDKLVQYTYYFAEHQTWSFHAKVRRAKVTVTCSLLLLNFCSTIFVCTYFSWHRKLNFSTLRPILFAVAVVAAVVAAAVAAAAGVVTAAVAMSVLRRE